MCFFQYIMGKSTIILLSSFACGCIVETTFSTIQGFCGVLYGFVFFFFFGIVRDLEIQELKKKTFSLSSKSCKKAVF